MLFGSTLLEVAIGMIFVYLLLSLLCSAFSELIESFIRFRARDLERGIIKLLGNKSLAQEFFNHPLIKPFGDTPSYISSRAFSLAIWNIATTKAAEAQVAAKAAAEKVAEAQAALAKAEAAKAALEGGTLPPPDAGAPAAGASGATTVSAAQTLADIRSMIAAVPGGNLGDTKKALLTLIDEAGNDINKARANIEQWYNDSMDRVSGWYKRRTHWILTVIGLLAALAFNVDTITVIKALWYNDALRTSVVAAATDYVKANPAPTPAPSGSTTTSTPAPTPKPTATPTPTTSGGTTTATPTPTPATTPSPATTPTPSPEQQFAVAREKIALLSNQINSLSLPIGWPVEPKEPNKGDDKYKDKEALYQADEAAYQANKTAYADDPRRWADGAWPMKLLGVLLTALAISQGAPFWFDLLNKFMVIRSTVKPTEKSPDEASKDRRPPADEHATNTTTNAPANKT